MSRHKLIYAELGGIREEVAQVVNTQLMTGGLWAKCQKNMKMWIALGRGKWGKQREEQLRREITVIIRETCYVTLNGYIIIMPVFPASLGAPRARKPSSFSFCFCILHTRCSEPIKADGVYWKQYTARGERGGECGIRLCWELKIHEACIITYIRQIYIPSTCLLIVISHRNGHFQNVKDLLETIWLKIQTL